MRLIDLGQGSAPLLFIHGFLCAADDWINQIEYFQSHRRIIVPTLRGHGGTPRGSEILSIPQLANECIALIEDKRLTNIILVGHSMGTRIVFEISRKIPDKIVGLVLLDGSRISESGGKEIQLQAFETDVDNLGYQKFIADAFSAMVSNSEFEQFRSKLVQRALSIPKKWVMELRSSTIQYDSDTIEKSVCQARMPLLVIQSTDSSGNQNYLSLTEGDQSSYSSFIKKNAEQVDIVQLSGIGHFAQFEIPVKVNSVINEWMKEKGI